MVKIAIAQINTTVGDIKGNSEKIIGYIEKARIQKADIVVFPELTITGYPAEDLWLKKDFISENRKALDYIIKKTKEVTAIVGFVDFSGGKRYNSAALIADDKLKGIQHKTCLPNYGVFDEKRYFEPAEKSDVFLVKDKKIGITICEDIWIDNGPINQLADKGVEVIINISASPFHAGKSKERRELISKRANESKVPVIYVNLVGGQDSIVFDGRSYVFNKNGELIKEAKAFEEDFIITELNEKTIEVKDDVLDEIYRALVLGTKDYVTKNGFKKVVLGLSGGVDSSITAAIAADALGKENVIGVLMPSAITSEESNKDAQELADNLGIKTIKVPIKEAVDAYEKALSNEFKGIKPNIAEENIQARIRGNILMALSNKFGYLVLTTSNKSESSVGYATLYGDMSGGFAVIADVFKTTVYEIAKRDERIPKNVLTKEPTAELRKGQKDTDSLPAYDILDPILKMYVEEDKSKDEIIVKGFSEEMVKDVIRKVDKSEYKRRQAAPNIKITPKAFGKDRRMPITNKYQI